MIEQGDVVWVVFPPPRGSGPAGRRPAVVVQHNRFNRTQLGTTVGAAITSHLRYAGMPGNVRLAKGEAGLTRPSVVNVTQIATIDRADIETRIGRLSLTRLQQVWEGVRLVLAPEP